MTTIGSTYAASVYQRSTGSTSGTDEGNGETFAIPVSDVHRFDTSNMNVSYYGPDFEDIYPGVTRFAKWVYEGENYVRPEPYAGPAHPGLKDYATITLDGETVATIDNFGVVRAKGGIFNSMIDALKAADASTDARSSPKLAQARAEAIAAALGGTVTMADTALTQAEFDSATQALLASVKTDTANPTDTLYSLFNRVSAA